MHRQDYSRLAQQRADFSAAHRIAEWNTGFEQGAQGARNL